MASSNASPEIQAAVSYLVSHLSASLSLSPETQATLANSLTANLRAKYESHWHPSDPERGSAYRAITRSSSNTLDDVLVTSLRSANIPLSEACKALNASMACDKWTLWIDPGCVSIRLQGAGGVQYNTNALDTTTSSPAMSSKLTVSGITEIWGKLPASVIAVVGVAGHAPSVHKSARKSKSVMSLSSAAAPKLSMEDEASVAAEFEALALNASPAGAYKKSKAIAIMKPVVHRGVASVAASSENNVASTPPRPLPPLCFTIQESTSPYVPSFSTSATAKGDTASTSSSGGNTITRATTPSLLGRLTSPPLYTSDSITSSSSSCSSASDPFARPSSRSSTTSLGSATSCSIFSHASSDSRSSSIGSFTAEDEKDEHAGNTTVTAAGVMKASKGEMDAAKSFTFPGSANGATPALLKADTLALLPVASAPNSPSKPHSSRRRHDRSASIISATSSNASHHSGSRRPSSRTEVRVEKETKPQEYSNGKVGVLGGGVMLGPKKDTSNSGTGNNNHKRNHSTASSNNGMMSTLNIAKTHSRPGKSRTTSSGSVTSNGSDYHNHHYQQQQHYGAYTHQQQQAQVGAYNWAHYPAPPTQIPHQYRY
ncbi:hypothetical protein P389DRAFT_51664 [Cystobasidium minutum MCA 4210]|uniref:uncharacterized protein n=1 Tax=Cystobasidium minutum MCA 4210 TaxID=1397322 RepID=UPI0034CFCC21|eukprot:jgi/Rhomi1/51664/CE51663_1029